MTASATGKPDTFQSVPCRVHGTMTAHLADLAITHALSDH